LGRASSGDNVATATAARTSHAATRNSSGKLVLFVGNMDHRKIVTAFKAITFGELGRDNNVWALGLDRNSVNRHIGSAASFQ
jgi:hypothetical protein